MLTAPWNIILTVLFAFTGLYCAVRLFTHRPRGKSGWGAGFDSTVIHVTHAVMSVAMIAMCWVMVFPDALNWAQIILFSALALALVPGLWRAPLVSRRVDLAGHIWLGAAMVWMIAAMPLLMAGMGGSMAGMGGSMDDGMGGSMAGMGEAQGDAMMMAMSTPAWVDAVNAVFVAGSLALTLWWLYRAVTIRGQRLHELCHSLMAVGMAAMLVLMNA
ncbi:DUF5134 domain-containing protein [Leucobacter sp. wl10]|uniref:DUF5134 domain-containing protein n=1 Tax=Leucobacter sp. wl10 TaxID=2304677 RepID=UPI000E5AA41A|nr:DUF5134 domain-containing protein [Leucobacter sp. wl10]RGE21595.1 DUF5134 domain-containing protein [Leucobacter sp. wl10]